ncbi:MAG: manganese efflux pump [Defluviitaleaceae bacterium]|nr:manganese efflux pump [Defluviitaleaceae bacterium]
MFMAVLSGLIVSVDAFFIGLSLGLQKKCKYLYLVAINVFLLALCFVGFFVAGQIYEVIPFDPDLIVGFAFIALGLWTIMQFFLFEHLKRRKGTTEEISISYKTLALVGIVMSGEAMLITMGITFIFLPDSTLIIPITVALAHFVYSTISFYLARTKHLKRIPLALSHTISGLALITYGLLALFVEFDVI